MIFTVLLFWIGVELAAPNWYFFLIFWKVAWGIVNFGLKMYEKGKNDK